jgi:DNA-binding transcriptional ArsR family regulator
MAVEGAGGPRKETDEPTGAANAESHLHTDEVFHLLQNKRRRRVIEYLRTHEDGREAGVDMRDVVEDIAAEEHGTSVAGLSSTERQRVYIALYQSHLPKLNDHGIIEYDQDRGWLRLTEQAEQLTPFLDIVNGEAKSSTDGRQLATPAILALGVTLVAGALIGVPPLAGTAVEASVTILLLTLLSVIALWNRV